MFVSKHHYALELARRGNKVFFVNPPNMEQERFRGLVDVRTSGTHPNLHLVYNRLFFPYRVKFHAISLFHLYMRWHVTRMLAAIKVPVDIVWSFDLSHVFPFEAFPKRCLKIFHPVDEPMNPTALNAARGADIVFSTAREILDKYQFSKTPSHVINHGLAGEFLEVPVNIRSGHPLHVGLSGNFLRHDIDRPVLKKIIEENPDCIFECWGSYEWKDANVGGWNDNTTREFIRDLKSKNNVVFHGVVPPAKLAAEFARMDLFLICYNLNAANRTGPNYHKVLEYLSTGKVIVSNYLSTYTDMRHLIAMCSRPDSNDDLPAIFKQVVHSISDHNSNDLLQQRRAYAEDNTYHAQVDRIARLIRDL